MPTIPLYQHQRQIASPSMPRATSSLFGNLGAQSEQLQQTIQKLEDTRDHRALTESQILLQEHDAKFEENALATPYKTPTERMEAYDKSLRAFTDTQLQNAPSTRARDALSNQLRAHAAQSKITQAQAAATAELKKSHTINQAAIDLAIKDGNLDLALRHYDEGIALGLYYAETRQNFIAQTQTRIQHNQVMRMVNTDPLLAKEQLEARDADGNPTHFTHLDESARYTLINHAERNFSQLATQTYEAISARMDDGEVIGDKELDELVARRLIDPKHAKALRKYQSTGKFNPVEHLELYNTILAYDPASDPNNALLVSLQQQTLAYPAPLRDRMLKNLDEQSKTGSPQNKPATQEILKRMDERFKHGLYGAYEEYHMAEMKDEAGKVIGEAKWVKKTNQANYEIALANLIRAKDEVRRFVQANPTASEYEINAHLRTFQDEMMGRVARDLLGNLIDKTVTDLTNAVNAPPALIRYGLWNKPTPANLITKSRAARIGY